MNTDFELKEILRKFEALSQKIQEDGKVDYSETNILINFIEPYLLNGDKHFVKFKELIDRCREDGEISDDESEQLIEQIQKIKKTLKLECMLLSCYGIAVYVIASGAVLVFIAKLFNS